MKVLLCDAHPEWAETLATLLQVEGHRVNLAKCDNIDPVHTAAAAPDVLFYNCQFNGVTYRLERLVALKRAPEARMIPVILICTNKAEALRALSKAGLEVEFVLCLPFTLNQLRNALETVEAKLRVRVN
ncbi:MAG: hypothetical protein DIU68_006615 [Chloroflexota bacterium]